jgi:hypothetical protein
MNAKKSIEFGKTARGVESTFARPLRIADRAKAITV